MIRRSFCPSSSVNGPKMVSTSKFLSSIRQSFTSITYPYSSISHPSQSFYGKFAPLKKWIKSTDLAAHNSASRFQSNLNIKRKYIQNLGLSGSKNVGKTFGVSVILGSMSFQSRAAYAMDGYDILVDDRDVDLYGASEMEEDSQAFWTFTKKFWLPVLLLCTVLVNWDHPITLVMKVVLFLLSTKPSPLSVYLSIEELCHQFMRQKPYLYKLKSLYAKKVEVQDYKLLCIARVEVGDQKFTLVGILGGWWILSSSQGVFSIFRDAALKHH